MAGFNGGSNQVGAVGARQEQRVRGKYPDGRHGVDGEDGGGPEKKIKKGTDAETQTDVDPEYYFHSFEQPRTRVGDAILADGDEDRSGTVREGGWLDG